MNGRNLNRFLIAQVGEVVTTIPTIGFNVEQVTYKNLKFQVWDLGGQTSIRWGKYQRRKHLKKKWLERTMPALCLSKDTKRTFP